MRALFLILLLSLPCQAGSWTQFQGTFSDVSFPAGKRVTRTLKVEIRLPTEVMQKGSKGPSGTIVIQEDQRSLEYKVANAYESRGQLVYLATRAESSIVILLPAPPPAQAVEQTLAREGILMFSDRESAREVRGTLFVQANLKLKR